MGRYYNGDIEGKFWFSVQSSNDADFFGVEGVSPEYLEYYFDESNLESVSDGLKRCKKALGKYKAIIDDYFAKNNGYNDKEMSSELKISESKLAELLEWYARLELGEKIYKQIKENGSCHFEAEL